MRARLKRWFLGAALLAALGRVAAADTYSASGITEPVADILLSTPVAGIVAEIKYGEGMFVASNAVILTLDKRLEELETTRRKVVLDNRKQDYQSTLGVYEKTKSVSRDEVDKKRAEYEVAGAEYETALEQLRRRQIIAPCAGVVAESPLDVGESCQAYQPVARLVDARQCYFVSNVEAKPAGRLQLGQVAKLEIDTTSGPTALTGKVVFLSPVVDPASGLQKVKLLFDNADGKVRPGLAGKLFIE
jgi:RND family efflux transporter MFP subunit